MMNDCKLPKQTPYSAIVAELYGVHCEYFRKDQVCYNVYVFFFGGEEGSGTLYNTLYDNSECYFASSYMND